MMIGWQVRKKNNIHFTESVFITVPLYLNKLEKVRK